MTLAPPAVRTLLAVLLGMAGTVPDPGAVPNHGTVPGTTRVAWRQLDLQTGRAIGSSDADDALDRPVPPGFAMQLPVLVAALESRTISANTRIACPGYAEIDGRRIACPHPRVRRPLTPAEALSYSCNAFFAAIGARVSRPRLDRLLSALGLPPAPAAASMPLVAIGAGAAAAPPSALLRAFGAIITEADDTRATSDSTWADRRGLALSASTRAVVLEGLRGGAVFGSASAFSARGVQALALAGVSPSGGESTRLVLAAWPPRHPTRALVLLTSGGTAAGAAEQAAMLTQDSRPATTVASRQQPVAGEDAGSTLRVGFASSSDYSVRSLEIEDYVARVIAGEAAPRSAPAALEALAITVRTFALANRGRHAREGFDLCDQTHCQVLREPYAAARAAAAGTAGLILTWQDAPASVYYTASCGGRTERPSNVWPGAVDPPYLPSRRDTACDADPSWSAEIAEPDLRRALAAAGYRGGTIRGVHVASRSGSGRVLVLRVSGTAPDEISGQALRMAVGRTLGWQLLKSADFDVRKTAGRYRFVGRGYGHGVGFCVIGAARRAASGTSRAALLDQYFPGLRLSRVTPDLLRRSVTPLVGPAAALASGEAAASAVPAPPAAAVRSDEVAPLASAPVRPAEPQEPAAMAKPVASSSGRAGVEVLLPAGDERERSYVTAVVERALAAAAARVAMPVPERVRVVFHSSVSSYVQETGQPAWSSGWTRAGRIDLQPVQQLRDRDGLEAAVAHEAGHLVTGTPLGGRARWVEEGAAMFAAGTIGAAEIAAARGAPAGACPSDAELGKPSSEAAERAALARARACYARALGRDLRWDEVR